jgi:hypothetical protein
MLRRCAGRNQCLSWRFFSTKSQSNRLPDNRSSLSVRFQKLTLANQVAVVGAPITVFLAVFGLWNQFAPSLPYSEGCAIEAIMQPFQSRDLQNKLERKAPPNLWIDRDDMLAKLKLLRSQSSKDDKYVLLLGEKGTGKSFMMYKFILNQPGVVYLFLGASTKAEDIEQKLLVATGFDTKKHPTDLPLPQLGTLLHSVDQRLAADGARPLVLIEIERSTDLAVIDTVCRTLKVLSNVCRGIVVMTEATAAVGFSPDEHRRLMIFMPDFSLAEARDYLSKINSLRKEMGLYEFSDVEIGFILERFGCRPAGLYDLATTPLPLKDIVDNVVKTQRLRIKSLLATDPKYAPVIMRMLEHGQIDDEELVHMLHQPIEKIAEVSMAKRHVFSYNPVNHCVQFHSEATREAARQWKAEEVAARQAEEVAARQARWFWWR